MLEAKITNRTLVLPSFIYARQCAVEQWVVLAFVDIRPTTNICDSRTNLTFALLLPSSDPLVLPSPPKTGGRKKLEKAITTISQRMNNKHGDYP